MDGVTILILIDGFLQSLNNIILLILKVSHNPYFNRWFSAIRITAWNTNPWMESQSLF